MKQRKFFSDDTHQHFLLPGIFSLQHLDTFSLIPRNESFKSFLIAFLFQDFILLLMKRGFSECLIITHCWDYLQVILLGVSKLRSPECKVCCHYPPDLVNRTVSHTETKDTQSVSHTMNSLDHG